MTNPDTTTNPQAAAGTEQGAHVAPEKATSKRGATRTKAAPKGQKAVKKAAKGVGANAQTTGHAFTQAGGVLR